MSRYTRGYIASQSTIQRVSHKHPCSVCGKSRWCSYTDELALCMRSSAGSVKRAPNGAHIHVLTPQLAPPPTPQSKVAEADVCETPIADENRRHEVYAAMLDMLTLTEAHGDHLLNERALSDTTIANALYASIPDEQTNLDVCAGLSTRFELSGVAGFYHEGNKRWKLAAYGNGFFVPYRDAQGRINGVQMRRFNVKPDEGKYIWLSTNDAGKYPRGASSGSPLHFAKPDLIPLREGIALITEGALKADIISEKLGFAVIASAGCAFPITKISEIEKALPELKIACVAFDGDYTEPKKEGVRNGMLRLFQTPKRFKTVCMDLEDANGKGLDDVAINAERIAA